MGSCQLDKIEQLLLADVFGYAKLLALAPHYQWS